MRFRTKPFEIEAVLFTGENFGEVREFCGKRPAGYVKSLSLEIFNPIGVFILMDDPEILASVYDELHSTHVGVKAGQWIIRGQKGEYYPCDPEIFEAKYEAVDE